MEDTGIPDRKRVDRESLDAVAVVLEQLRGVVPEVFADGKVDFELLRAAVGESIESSPDRYRFSWAGQQDAIRAAQTPTFGALLPGRDESLDFDGTSNAVVAGDNLEVLKLLGRAYFEKIKCIYIDPPYNVGTDKLYKDDFKDPKTAYLRQTGQMNGNGQYLVSTAESSGRYHSAWLSMLFPRLWWARKLLRDDGVIFVSIDDHEVHHVRLLMDAIFAPENHIANLPRSTQRADPASG